MAVDLIKHFAPYLNPEKNKSAVDLMVGAPGWWISRAFALYLQRNRHRDISQIVLDKTTPMSETNAATIITPQKEQP